MKYHLVIFYSEGPPHDNALPLEDSYKKLMENEDVKKEFDEVHVYTPRILKSMGYDDFVKDYGKRTWVTHGNPGIHAIGNNAWKPLIIRLVLEKAEPGDIVVYRDMNVLKYKLLNGYRNFRRMINTSLQKAEFDFFVPREHEKFDLEQNTKTNVLRELGENHPFSYRFPLLIVHLVVFRKTNISMEFIAEWEKGVSHGEWIDNKLYGENSSKFKWYTPEQSVMSVIVANWVRKRKHNIPLKYPQCGFPYRNTNTFISFNNYKYLELLENTEDKSQES
jgi:hypothetical protein